MTMNIQPFYDERTSTITYVVYDEQTKDAVVIDPVLDYNPVGSKIWTESVEEVLEFLEAEDLNLHYILETHAHADHLSGSQEIKQKYPDAKLAVGERITVVQETFKDVFDLPDDFPTDGRQFDRLLEDGEEFSAGSIDIKVMATPGHTPACVSYIINDAVFTGDALFMPDMGTGRCDFPAGNAVDMYKSIHDKLYSLPDDTRVFVGHDYQPGDREEPAWESTIGEQKRENIQLTEDTTVEEYVKFRTERDKTLDAPRLLFQSVQVNVDAGNLPEAQANKRKYLKIPLNVFRPEEGDEITEEEVARSS
jgi:glyoxylase-like metal-dependent hydrolase (beta-lactamase superfamily II)